MTQDEIIRMAREAGLQLAIHAEAYPGITQQLERFAALVAAHAKSEQINLAYQQGYEDGSAHEREACAKVCEDHFSSDGHWCAAAIRAMGNNAGN